MEEFASSPLSVNHKYFNYFRGMKRAHLVQDSHKYLVPSNGHKVVKTIKHTFKARDDDVFLVAFPKTGITWMQEIVFLLMNDMNIESANKIIRDQAYLFLELSAFDHKHDFDLIKLADVLPSPRLIKTHLPYSLLPLDAIHKKCKFIYICRNARDTMISYYYFAKANAAFSFDGSVEEFVDLFMDDLVPFAPYVSHVEEFWQHRTDSNVFFTSYEELKNYQKGIIGKVAKFLGKPVTPEQIEILDDHCTFDNMKNNEAANKNHFKLSGAFDKNFNFMRKGIIGDWKSHFTPDMNSNFKSWIEQKTSGHGELEKLLTLGQIPETLRRSSIKYSENFEPSEKKYSSASV